MKFLKILIILTFSINSVGAQQNIVKLKVGDIAPSLNHIKWLKGDSISDFHAGKVYVVDFGFIGCVPCMEGWPHLTAISQKYSGKVDVIGIFTLTKSISQAENYLLKMGNRMNYNIGIDIDNKMDSMWVIASGERSYPKIFFIDKNRKIAHITGTSDFEKLDQYISQLADGNFDPKIAEQDEIRSKEFFSQTYEIYLQGKLTETLVRIDSAISLKTNNLHYKEFKFKILLEKNEERGYEYGWNVLNNYPWGEGDNVWALAKSWAALILDNSDRLKTPDYELALAMCMKAIELVKANDLKALAYDKASWTYFAMGNPSQGEKMSSKAIELAKETEPQFRKFYTDMFSSNLRSYKQRFSKN